MEKTINIFIMREGAIVDRGEFDRAHGEGAVGHLMGRLMVKYGEIGAPKVIKMFRDMGQLVIFPRFIGVAIAAAGMAEAIVDLPLRGAEVRDKEALVLTEEQAIVADYLMADVFNEERLEAGSASCNLQMQAGTGKTYLGLEIIRRLKQRALWITPRRFLAEQTRAAMAKYVEGVVMHPWAIEGALVTIMVINSAIKEDKAFFDQFGLIIYDEVHMYCGAEYSNIFWKAQGAYCLGLSATMEHRRDKFDVVYYKHLGPVVKAADVLLGAAKEGPRFKGLVNVVHYRGAKAVDIHSETTGKLFTPAIVKALAADEERNRLIIDWALKLYEDGHYFYVFSEFRWHIEVLRGAFLGRLRGRNKGPPDETPERDMDGLDRAYHDLVHIESDTDKAAEGAKGVALKGGATVDEMGKAMAARVIFTTYGYAGTGVSIVHMTGAIFATPRRNGYEQICARVMRRGSDEAIERAFVDIVDDHSALRWQLGGRKVAYKMYGFRVKHVTICE